MDELLLEEEKVIVDTVPDQLITIAERLARMEVTIESIQQAIHQLEGQLKRKLEAKDEMLAKKRKLYCAICKLSGHETTKCRKGTAAQKIQWA
ncbi:unnamed protein product [Caenorhabditis nigoni]